MCEVTDETRSLVLPDAHGHRPRSHLSIQAAAATEQAQACQARAAPVSTQARTLTLIPSPSPSLSRTRTRTRTRTIGGSPGSRRAISPPRASKVPSTRSARSPLLSPRSLGWSVSRAGRLMTRLMMMIRSGKLRAASSRSSRSPPHTPPRGRTLQAVRQTLGHSYHFRSFSTSISSSLSSSMAPQPPRQPGRTNARSVRAPAPPAVHFLSRALERR